METAAGEGAGAGDWRDLWREYGPRLLLFARQQTSVASEAEDLVQETFLRYWRVRGSDPALSPGVMFTMVRRLAIDAARKREGRSRTEARAGVAEEPAAQWFADPVEARERRDALEGSLRALPPGQREVLVLKIWGELTFEQIGETLGISPNTAASRYRYALEALRQSVAPAVL